MILRVISVLLVPVTIVALLGPVDARASVQPEPEPESVADPESVAELEDAPAVSEAKRLFDEGASKFETADYGGAIELWTRAYGLVPNVPENAAVKARLIANLAAAHERAYAVDDKVDHLNQAKILIESYRRAIDDIYTDADERASELAWINERVSKIDAELQAAAERERAARPVETKPGEPGRAPGRALVLSGSVLTGLGVAGLGVMIGGMVIGDRNNDITDIPTNDLDARETRFARGRLGNGLAIAGGIGGAALLGTGVALLVIGLKQKRAAGQTEPARATLVPILDPTQAGLGVVGRF